MPALFLDDVKKSFSSKLREARVFKAVRKWQFPVFIVGVILLYQSSLYSNSSEGAFHYASGGKT